MKVAYVIGPYRSKAGDWTLGNNIGRAAIVARELWAMGYAVICPHTNSALFSGTDIEELIFMEGYLVLLERSDFAVVCDDWDESAGSIAEIQHARQVEVPVYRLKFGQLTPMEFDEDVFQSMCHEPDCMQTAIVGSDRCTFHI